VVEQPRLRYVTGCVGSDLEPDDPDQICRCGSDDCADQDSDGCQHSGGDSFGEGLFSALAQSHGVPHVDTLRPMATNPLYLYLQPRVGGALQFEISHTASWFLQIATDFNHAAASRRFGEAKLALLRPGVSAP